jgi:hypothetical protein
VRPRIVYLVHEQPGRLRFRLTWLREHRDEGDPLARQLADLDGITEVQVRPFTGSVLLLFDITRTDAEALKRALLRLTGERAITPPGQETPEQLRAIAGDSLRRGSEVTRAAAELFEELNLDFLRATGGRLSLGAFTALSLWGLAATKVVGSERIEMPAWYQLVWWGFRSFGTMEHEVFEDLHRERVATVSGEGGK